MTIADFGYAAGIIPIGQTQVVVQMPAGGGIDNVSSTLMSADSARAIELCTNGLGTEYFSADYDANSATMRVLVSIGPVTHIRFTGAAGDAYRVQT